MNFLPMPKPSKLFKKTVPCLKNFKGLQRQLSNQEILLEQHKARRSRVEQIAALEQIPLLVLSISLVDNQAKKLAWMANRLYQSMVKEKLLTLIPMKQTIK